MSEALGWPPRKEDLERMYLVEKLSAARIAARYGLKYKSPKVAESTVLYQLKKNGIRRRDRAEHLRKITAETVDSWVLRYQNGESLKQIAGNDVDAVSVWSHLRKRGVRLRDKVQAQIDAVTKYVRLPFRGGGVEKAYLIGLRYGDLDVVRHGRAIRVRVSTSHPAMAQLFDSLFSSYGHVSRYPRESMFSGYEWNLETDLDQSFDFLLRRPALSGLRRFDDLEFAAFLGGFFDAEGSVFLHKKHSGKAPEVQISNLDLVLLKFISKRLNSLGIASKVSRSEQSPRRLGYEMPGHIWKLQIWRFEDVGRLLGLLLCKHSEKMGKISIASRFVSPISDSANYELVRRWEDLSDAIEKERVMFVSMARKAMSRDVLPCDDC